MCHSRARRTFRIVGRGPSALAASAGAAERVRGRRGRRGAAPARAGAGGAPEAVEAGPPSFLIFHSSQRFRRSEASRSGTDFLRCGNSSTNAS